MYNVGNCGEKWGIDLRNAHEIGSKWGVVEHMFLGEYLHNIDSKGRLTLPAKFRGELARGVVVTRGFEGCLVVYPVDEWEKLTQKIDSLPHTQKDARMLARLLYSGAGDCIPDKQGRVLLPTYLREFASVDGETMIIGLHNRLEIWNPERWRSIKDEMETQADIIAEHFAGQGI